MATTMWQEIRSSWILPGRMSICSLIPRPSTVVLPWARPTTTWTVVRGPGMETGTA